MWDLVFGTLMAPYWVFGLFMFFAVYNSSHRDLLAINLKAFRNFAIFVFIATIIRFFVARYLNTPEDIAQIHEIFSWIPTWSTLLVPWEDMVHTVPLAIVARMLPDNYFCRVFKSFIIMIVMIDFGLGHIYQGLLTSVMLAFYIPITLHYGKKYGFGTVMLCHVLYDFTTMVLIKYLI